MPLQAQVAPLNRKWQFDLIFYPPSYLPFYPLFSLLSSLLFSQLMLRLIWTPPPTSFPLVVSLVFHPHPNAKTDFRELPITQRRTYFANQWSWPTTAQSFPKPLAMS